MKCRPVPVAAVEGGKIRAGRAGIGDDDRIARAAARCSVATTRSGRIGRSLRARQLLERRELSLPGSGHGSPPARARRRPIDPLAQRRQQGREREPGVAQHRDLGRIGGAEHRGVGVDLHDARLARLRVAPALGGDRARAAADEADEISAAAPSRASPTTPPLLPTTPTASGWSSAIAALAAHRGRDRRLEQLGERGELGLGARDHRPAAADEHRLAGRRRAHRQPPRPGPGPARCGAPGTRPSARIAAHIRLVDRIALDVERQPDMRSARPPRGHGAKRGAEGRRQLGGAVDHLARLG